MPYNIFHLEEFVQEETKRVYDFLDDIENNTDYDRDEIYNEYCNRFQTELEEFFDAEYGEAFDIFGKEHTKEIALEKKNFLLDIYAYASFGDFCSFNTYKKSAGEFNNALNYLSHIPHNFHLELYQNHQDLFGDLKYSEIETKVEELFFELHNQVYAKFENKVAFLNEKLPIFNPLSIEELEVLQEYYDDSTIDMRNLLKADNTAESLLDKNDYLLEHLQNEVFSGIYMPSSSQEPYNDNSIIFDEPCNEFFTLKAREELESLGYEMAVFKDIKPSQWQDNDSYVFAYARNAEDLQGAFEYLNKKSYYKFDATKSTKDYLNLYQQNNQGELNDEIDNEKKEVYFTENSLFSEKELQPSKQNVEIKSYDEIMEAKMRKRGRV